MTDNKDHSSYHPQVFKDGAKGSTGGALLLGTRSSSKTNLNLWINLEKSYKLSESTATGIYFKVYTDYPLNASERDIRVRLGSADGTYNGSGDGDGPGADYVQLATETTGEWATIYVPFTAFENIGANADVENTHLFFILNRAWTGSSGNYALYIDEIGFYNE